jgi:plasmid replication initiation protein
MGQDQALPSARALDIAIAEITKKTDISIAIESLARSKYRRISSVNFSIKAQAVANAPNKKHHQFG